MHRCHRTGSFYLAPTQLLSGPSELGFTTPPPLTTAMSRGFEQSGLEAIGRRDLASAMGSHRSPYQELHRAFSSSGIPAASTTRCPSSRYRQKSSARDGRRGDTRRFKGNSRRRMARVPREILGRRRVPSPSGKPLHKITTPSPDRAHFFLYCYRSKCRVDLTIFPGVVGDGLDLRQADLGVRFNVLVFCPDVYW
jgi:hypothetical protein